MGAEWPHASGEAGRGRWTPRQEERGGAVFAVARLAWWTSPAPARGDMMALLAIVGRGAKHGAKSRVVIEWPTCRRRGLMCRSYYSNRRTLAPA